MCEMRTHIKAGKDKREDRVVGLTLLYERNQRWIELFVEWASTSLTHASLVKIS